MQMMTIREIARHSGWPEGRIRRLLEKGIEAEPLRLRLRLSLLLKKESSAIIHHLSL